MASTQPWVFFDIGDVLFDEDPQHNYYFHSLLLAMRRNGLNVAWDDYHARIQSYVRVEPGTAILEAAKYYVSDPDQWQKIFHEGRAEYLAMRRPRPYGLLLDNITAVLEDLSRDFNLGVIANQHPSIVEALDDYGIGPMFQVKAIDEVVGVSKPDPAIFQWALNAAGCPARDAIIVGDRPDNDIAPAKAVGMGTVRFRRGILYALCDPRREEERADTVVRDVSRLAAAVRRLAAERGG